MRVSHGCFHVYPENEVQLFSMVKVGTPVRSIDEPYLVGSDGDGHLYLQSFGPIEAYKSDLSPQQRAVNAIVQYQKTMATPVVVNWQRVINLVQNPNTVPTGIDVAAPDLEQVVSALPAQPYAFAPYGDDANQASPPPVPKGTSDSK